MLTRFLGPTGPARTLAIAMLVTSVGNGLYITTFALYATRVAGLSPAQLGISLGAAAVTGVLAGVLLGLVADRFGSREVSVVLIAATGVATLVYLVCRSFPAFLVTACFYALVSRGSNSARVALMSTVLEGQLLVTTRARLQVITNLGMSAGAALGAVTLLFDTPVAYSTALAIDALSFFGCAAWFTRMPKAPPMPKAEAGEGWLPVLRDRPYAVVALVNTLMLSHAPLLDVILPLWIVWHTDAPKSLAAGLILLNTAAVVLMQVRVSDRINNLRLAVRAFRLCGAVLAVACLFYAGANNTPVWLAITVLVLGAAVHAYGEMVHSAGSWIVAYELAPAHQQGQYQGLFSTGLTVSQTVAPAVLTIMIIEGGAWGWFVLAAAFLFSGLVMGPAAAWAERTRTKSPGPVSAT